MQSKKVKLLSGWTNPGGSTVHHINLVNLLNSNGFEATLYGPHDWHLDKCRAKKANDFSDLELGGGDVLITHFVHPSFIPKIKNKHILSCHETNLFQVNASIYDAIHFVSESQKNWHKIDDRKKDKCFVIPPIVEKIEWVNPNNTIAGVIGSIDPHKQTHLAIVAALISGYTKVYLYGLVSDIKYYTDKIIPWIERGQVVLKGHENNKKKMYSSISAVFHYSKRETYGLVEAECKLAGIPFHGNENNQLILSDEEILKKWIPILEL